MCYKMIIAPPCPLECSKRKHHSYSEVDKFSTDDHNYVHSHNILTNLM